MPALPLEVLRTVSLLTFLIGLILYAIYGHGAAAKARAKAGATPNG